MDEPQRAPAAERNRDAITAIWRGLLPARGAVLEVASGTGQHIAHWAERFPSLTWQPSDIDPAALRSIQAWRAFEAYANLAAPIMLDVANDDWPMLAPGPWAAIIAVNLLHISPWPTTQALLAGAGRTLAKGGQLLLYGPFAERGVLEPASNVAFDGWLRERNASWGVRDTVEIEAVARTHGLLLREQVAMPANNRVLVLHRGGVGG